MKTIAVILIIIVVLGFVYFISLKLKAKPIIKPMGKPNFFKISRSCQDDIDRAEGMKTEKDRMFDSISFYIPFEMICPSTGEKMRIGGGSRTKYLQKMGWTIWSETKPKPIIMGLTKPILMTGLNTFQRNFAEPERVAEAEILTGITEQSTPSADACIDDEDIARRNTNEDITTKNRKINLTCPHTNQIIEIKGYNKSYYLYRNLGWKQI